MNEDLPQLLQSVPEGWWAIMRRLHAELAAECPDIDVLYAKEKFGALRVGLQPHHPLAARLREDAEQDLLITCQECGRSGLLTMLCDTHFADPKKKFDDP